LQRPFVNYYGPVFVLYELSTPFLNIHWFCDKLNMTGSTLQWYNGIVLLLTFFGCRLVWGTYQSVCVFRDIWQIMQTGIPAIRDVHSSPGSSIFVPRDGQLCMGKESCVAAQTEVMKFAHDASIVPMWLAMTYLGSNMILHSLNFYWFGRMIETVRKRFEGKEHDEFKHERERRQSLVEELASGLDENEISGPKTLGMEKSEASATGVDEGAEIGKRRKDL
jgi:TLC domain